MLIKQLTPLRRKDQATGYQAAVRDIVAWLFDEEQEYPAGQYSGFAAMIREEIETKFGGKHEG